MVSIIVRSHNDGAILPRTLAGLATQTMRDFEVVVCDDRSTDDTAACFERSGLPCRFLPPPEGPYKPGVVLNRAVAAAKGDLIVFNNSDAVILNDDWLKNLIAPLQDPTVAATFANQLPRQDAWAVVRMDYLKAFGDGSVSKHWRHFFSLASSAGRRELFLEYPFSETLQYSEDIDWSYRMKQTGKKIVYVEDARVEHSHNYSFAELAKRFFNEGKADRVIFGESQSFGSFFATLIGGTLRDLVRLKKDWLFVIRYRFAQKYHYYRGTHAS